MTRLSQFNDVREVLDSALASGGGRYLLATRGQAVHFRHRCYTFRKAFAEQTGDYRYDKLVFPRIPAESSTVLISVQKAAGLFLANSEPGVQMETDREAADLASKLFGKDAI